jgi:hypothetical protein
VSWYSTAAETVGTALVDIAVPGAGTIGTSLLETATNTNTPDDAAAALQQQGTSLANTAAAGLLSPPTAFGWTDLFGGKLVTWGSVITMGIYLGAGSLAVVTFGPLVYDLVQLVDVPVKEARKVGQHAVKNPSRSRLARRARRAN